MQLSQRIQAFDQLGKSLRNLNPEKLDTWSQAAKAENPWFTRESVERSINGLGEFLDSNKLTEWTKQYSFDHIKPKNVGIVMAGNIPMVGFHDLLCVLVSGHRAQVKLSSKDSVLIKILLQNLTEIEPGFKDQISFVDGPMKNFDAVIATGSDNSARYFLHYFGKYPNIIRKNRTSCAVLSGAESPEEIQALGNDIFTYFGLGCRNVSKLFIPEGFNLPQLLDQWRAYENIIHHHKYNNNYDYQKAILLVNQIPHLDTGYLLLQESERLVSPISVLFYEYYADEQQVKHRIDQEREKLQCIVGKKSYCTVSFGKTQSPGLADYADDINTLVFLKSL